MDNLARWVLEIAIVLGLLAIAVGIEFLTPAPTLLVGLLLALSILVAHMLFDHYTQQEDL